MLLRATVGLLPDESPYTTETAEKKLQTASVVAGLLMCEDDPDMKRCKKSILEDTRPVVSEAVDLFNSSHCEKWDAAMKEPLKIYIGKDSKQKVCPC